MPEYALPATRYAVSGDISIAFQTIGEAPHDIVMGSRFMVACRIRASASRIHRIPQTACKIRANCQLRQKGARTVRPNLGGAYRQRQTSGYRRILAGIDNLSQTAQGRGVALEQ
jgi:hypothetical protein